ncbi:uncharacterized protein F5147DRAFT_590072 [Suillus discolor]|uniref:Uncharacterized protein n=1 Tax=Suillus discolor TaxID=1912936 RepID=A0A9P7ERC3_9AGAM|nr:uncharacterized protein F5147DRAFT_590072 [Suillus discolor]KAG2083209.1 hypothetical protein F5147DRAFT_590072 [Suillus discolor]
MPYVIDWGYRFPEPALLLGSKLPERLQGYIATWLTCRLLWIGQVNHDPPCNYPSPQLWHDFLGSGLTTQSQGATPKGKDPCPIIHGGIFLPDVDDEIWQDIGLDEDGINPPAWLSDEATRSGIHLQLEVDWCVKEETCLMQEQTVMQEWMFAEWEAMQTVLRDVADDLVVSFHMWAHADELFHICVIWKKKPVESWGPQNEDILQAARDQVQPSFFQYKDDDKSVGEQEESDEDGDLAYYEVGDDELMDAIEEVALADEYRYQDEDFVHNIEDTFMPSSPTKSSLKKRCCM